MSTSAPDRKFWSERHGRGPGSTPFDLDQLRRLVFSALDELVQDDFFQEAFGYYCVDNGDVPGTAGRDINAWFLRTIHRDGVWPYRKNEESYDADTLFDVLEALHDVVSAPVRGRFHDFGGCGWHYHEFNAADGRSRLRTSLNPLLARYNPALEMDDRGEILLLSPQEMQPLLAAPIPSSADHELEGSRVAEAVRIFRSRNTTLVDRRQAVRELADVLEVLRPEIKEEMLPKDERELFAIANGFAIRHNNREQRRDYDDAIWLSWAFYVYLATVHAVLRLRERQQELASTAD